MLENNAYVFPGDTQNLDGQLNASVVQYSDYPEPPQPKY